MVAVTGIGSWPGTDVREALRVVRGELAEPGDVQGLPYLPELPERGPGADMIGRAAGVLVDLPVDLQPQGWRLVDRPGRDAERTAALWRQDLDELAEAFDGWAGPLKVQLAGPWTLAAQLWLPRGDRVLSDTGAVRDLVVSLAEGAAEHVRKVRALVPGAEVVVQLDEPSLPAVLAGRLRSDSGVRALPTPDAHQAQAWLTTVVDAARGAGARGVAIHCCAAQPPVRMLRGTGIDAVAIDLAQLNEDGWEQAAAAVEAGVHLWAGVLPTGTEPDVAAAIAAVLQPWGRIGLEPGRLQQVTVTPACGLAGIDPELALRITSESRAVAAALAAQE